MSTDRFSESDWDAVSHGLLVAVFDMANKLSCDVSTAKLIGPETIRQSCTKILHLLAIRDEITLIKNDGETT